MLPLDGIRVLDFSTLLPGPLASLVLAEAGVMAKLGLGFEQWRAANPKIIYCAITGYGQSGPLAMAAGHDLNFQARTGLLGQCVGNDGMPGMPAILAGDIAGGSWPAVVNILLALRHRDRTGEGCCIDIAMAENLFTFLFWGLAAGNASGTWPEAGRGLFTGGSPRYRIYATADGRHLAVAPLEDKFWFAFCEAIALPAPYRDDAKDPAATMAAVAERLGAKPAAHWEALFEKADCCVSVVRTLEEAVHDLHFRARGVFDRNVSIPGHVLPALPLPLASPLRRGDPTAPAPDSPISQPSGERT